jgi:hypothetical protein
VRSVTTRYRLIFSSAGSVIFGLAIGVGRIGCDVELFSISFFKQALESRLLRELGFGTRNPKTVFECNLFRLVRRQAFRHVDRFFAHPTAKHLLT